MTIRNPLSSIIVNRFPAFLKLEYRNLYDLLENYFLFLEEQGNPLEVLENLQQRLEVNNEEPIYIDHIIKELGFNTERELSISKKELVHHLREFYLNRGNEVSFRFIFKIFFGVDCSVTYPREELFIPSAAIHERNNYIYLPYSASIFGRKDKLAYLQGVVSGVRANIEEISNLYGNTTFTRLRVESSKLNLAPSEGIKVTFPEEDVSFTLALQSVLGYSVLDGGLGYKEGDKVNVTGATRKGIARVKKTENGGITTVTITNGGSGYYKGDTVRVVSPTAGNSFSAFVSGIDLTGTITRITILSTGYNYEEVPSIAVESATGSGAILVAGSNNIGKIKEIEFLEPYLFSGNTEDITFSVVSTQGSGASIAPIVETMYRQKSSIIKKKGVLGENCTLIDSNYYQQFSYKVRSPITSARYGNIVDEWAHPAGFVRFSTTELSYTTPIPKEFFDSEEYGNIYDYVTVPMLEYTSGNYWNALLLNPISNINTSPGMTLESVSFQFSRESFPEFPVSIPDTALQDNRNYISEAMETSKALIREYRETSNVFNAISNVEHYKISTDFNYPVNYFIDKHYTYFWDDTILFDKALDCNITIVLP